MHGFVTQLHVRIRQLDEDLNEVYRKWGDTEVCKKWNARLAKAYKLSPSIDGASDVDTLEKIFDLNQQLSGKLEAY